MSSLRRDVDKEASLGDNKMEYSNRLPRKWVIMKVTTSSVMCKSKRESTSRAYHSSKFIFLNNNLLANVQHMVSCWQTVNSHALLPNESTLITIASDLSTKASMCDFPLLLHTDNTCSKLVSEQCLSRARMRSLLGAFHRRRDRCAAWFDWWLLGIWNVDTDSISGLGHVICLKCLEF